MSSTHDVSSLPSRGAVTGAALWSLPVLTAAIAAPGAAASTGASTLTFAAAPLLDVYAPFGTPAVTIRNTTAATYRGPLVLSTPSWSTTAPFTIPGATFATETRSGVPTDTWTIADATIAAQDELTLPLTWSSDYPAGAELQPLTVEEGTGAARVRSTGSATLSSGYQLLWFAATPGGQGNTAGSPGFFIANTTPADLTSALSTIRTRVWRFPLVSAPGISANGIPYTGRRLAEDGQFSAVYADVPTVVTANGDRLDFTIVWTQAGPSAAQQTVQMLSVITELGASLASLGDLRLYAPFTPV